ncbi:MAG: C40 family peptidase [Gammaproteobacteria bacterium]
MSRIGRPLSCAALLLVAACNTRFVSPNTAALDHTGLVTGQEVVAVAKTLVGAPYKYGGTTPDGFDCSGLVQYAYKKAGLNVPRSTKAQLRYAASVSVANVSAGDVLFFRVSDRKVAHVGIYTGDGRFIHAPSTGRRVSYSRIDNPFWKKRLVSAGRLY